ncbi:hypothetical protein COCCADRAFT_88701, partial [Bipolaris zeicola 26-R-13]
IIYVIDLVLKIYVYYLVLAWLKIHPLHYLFFIFFAQKEKAKDSGVRMVCNFSQPYHLSC